MRTSMRRFTRFTNGFGKTLANQTAAVALHDMHDNFARLSPVAPRDPAMETGVVNYAWSVEAIVGLLG